MQGTGWFRVSVVAIDEDAAAIVLTGEMDLAAVAGFEAVFRATLMSRPTDVVIDLGPVDFIDAAGLGALLRARRLGEASDIRVTFDRPSPACRWLLEICQRDDLLDPAGAASVGA